MKRTILSLILLATLLGYYYYGEIKPQEQAVERSVATRKLFVLPEGATLFRMKVQKNETAFVVEGKDDIWRIIEPVLEVGDPLILGGMERVLKLQNKEKVITDHPDTLAEYGLETPDLRVSVLSSNANAYRTLAFGKAAPFGNAYYARWEDQSEIFTVSANARNAFDKDLFSVRDKSIFKISLYDKPIALQIDLEPYHMHLTYDAEKEQWLLSEPFAELANSDIVEKYIHDLETLTIQEFLSSEDVHSVDTEISETGNRIQIATEKGESFILRLGRPTDDAQALYASVPGKAAPVLVSRAKIDPLKRDPVDFIERRIHPFKPMTLARLIYQKGQREEVYEKLEGAWQYQNSALSEEKLANLNSLIASLSALSYQLILNDEGVAKLAFTPEDTLFRLSLVFFDHPDDPFNAEIISKSDGFFLHGLDDGNYYEIIEDDYKKLLISLEFLLA